MGNASSSWWRRRHVFTPQQLDEYQECTFFSKQDIMRLYHRFYRLNPTKVPTCMHNNAPAIVTLTFEELERMPELRENPLRRRLCEVFSDDGLGNVTFDNFLDMFSVLSEPAPLQLKLKWAFRMYDFDGDGSIGREDCARAVRSVTRDELTREEVQFVSERLMEELDVDGDGAVSFAEFEHVLARSPDFARTFRLRV